MWSSGRSPAYEKSVKEPPDRALSVSPGTEKVSEASWLMWLNILKRPPYEVCWPSLSVVEAV